MIHHVTGGSPGAHYSPSLTPCCIGPPPLLSLPAAQAPLLRRLCDVAAGVAYLHQAGVCHGDLKCENVLLKSDPEDPDGCVAKVADFGLSRALQAGQVRQGGGGRGTGEGCLLWLRSLSCRCLDVRLLL
jgi:serine/threonine protein kinase